jgi:predicted TIM-barrel fold metal-dependent hydrolase
LTASVLDQIKVIDSDTHVIEPPDLWTSRVSVQKWGDLVPHVKWDDSAQEMAWFFGDKKVSGVASAAMAGWHQYPPYHAARLEDVDPATWDAHARLRRMDEYGIHAAVLYPNVAGFGTGRFLEIKDSDLMLACVRAYNDFLTDFSSADTDRYLPMMALPFWDLDDTIKEIHRAAGNGHKGIVMGSQPEFWGQPDLTDRHWDPLWATAQELGLPINFHIASGDVSDVVGGNPQNGPHANYAANGVVFFMGNARAIARIICGGICHRFPELNFVSVESGVGWLPYALDCIDWQWKNCGVPQEHPEYDLLPSEYFKRQIYGCFWFERRTARTALEMLGPDNILYETDFPHPTSMAPGPATTAIQPNVFLREAFSDLPEDTLRKILHDNAARIYHLN